MSDASFFDSNVLIYTFDATDLRKRTRATQLVGDAIASDEGVISYQVVQETLNIVTRRLSKQFSADDRDLFMRDVLLPMWRVMPSAALFREGLSLQERYQFNFYDSMIVAAALIAGCKRLYSEDLQHGQKIGRLEIVNPFL